MPVVPDIGAREADGDRRRKRSPLGRAPIHPALEEMLTNIGDFVMRLRDTLRSSLADAIESGDWSKVGERLVGTLKRLFAERTADRIAGEIEGVLANVFQKLAGPGGPLARFAQTALGGLFGGSSGGGGGGFSGIGGLLGGAFGPLGSIAGGLLGGLFHEGGVVPGAAGQERLIVAQAGEVVLNRAQQQALAGGGGGATINMQLTGNVDDATLRAMRRYADELAGIVGGQFRETGASFA